MNEKELTERLLDALESMAESMAMLVTLTLERQHDNTRREGKGAGQESIEGP